ncbi:MAG: PIN domain-containing protein [Coriobacteriales bacterium]|jgi:predicted nucleic acid-binding protein|nr:PIN domain-containing protein [Coriobacteriales bacterium]
MRGKAFIDTNVLVYLQSATDAGKRDVSRRAIDALDCVCSTQVLSELANVLVRKAKIPHDRVGEIIDGTVQACDLAVVTHATVQNALRIAKENVLGVYDSLIVASALESGCEYLVSEDLTDGQRIEGKLTIVNVYAHPEFFD